MWQNSDSGHWFRLSPVFLGQSGGKIDRQPSLRSGWGERHNWRDGREKEVCLNTDRGREREFFPKILTLYWTFLTPLLCWKISACKLWHSSKIMAVKSGRVLHLAGNPQCLGQSWTSRHFYTPHPYLRRKNLVFVPPFSGFIIPVLVLWRPNGDTIY